MIEYINRDLVRRIIDTNRSRKQMLRLLDAILTADVRENVHASWVKESENCVMGEGYMWFCSRCDNRIYVDTNGKFPKFCDECGADMRGKTNG